MRKAIILTPLVALGLAAGAAADKPQHPSHPAKPPQSCHPREVGYRASGTLTSAALTPAAHKGRFDGTVTVDVKRANHHGATGSQIFTLTSARVIFHKGVDSSAPAAGSRVGLHGKLTALRHGCTVTGFTPTLTIKKVDISRAQRS